MGIESAGLRALTRQRAHRGERTIRLILLLCGVVSIATTLGIIASLLLETFDFFRGVSPGEFFTGTSWGPTFKPASFGVLPLVNATVLIALAATIIAVPLGLGSAIFLSEFARPRTRNTIKPILEVLAGIPTVVFGYFGLTFLTPTILQRFVPGTGIFNALGASIIIGIAIVPLVASLSEDAMRAVPQGLREGAYAMGATRRTVSLRVVVPAALSGIMAGVILALSRAIGETMIVAIMAGQVPNLSFDPRQPMETMTAFIVQISLGDAPYGSIEYKTIFAIGTTLFAMTLLLNIASFWFVRRFRERYE
jgi:phosphate transport system permease protein